MTAKVLETAMRKAKALPEPAQEQIGREILARIEALETLRSDLKLGIDQLDAGLGEEIDFDDLIREARHAHAQR